MVDVASITWQPVPEHEAIKNGRTSFWKLTVVGQLQSRPPEVAELDDDELDAAFEELATDDELDAVLEEDDAPPALPLVAVASTAAPPVVLLTLVDEATVAPPRPVGLAALPP